MVFPTDSLTVTHTQVHYIYNAQYGIEVDIWAFGSMVFEIASGLAPNGANIQTLREFLNAEGCLKEMDSWRITALIEPVLDTQLAMTFLHKHHSSWCNCIPGLFDLETAMVQKHQTSKIEEARNVIAALPLNPMQESLTNTATMKPTTPSRLPRCAFAEDLLEMYPDAHVISKTREDAVD
ncbi:hypothetical protein F5Y18DRAFT_437545 [Xylariaceae sp. FL1019]|nr:hypothetical protein F5Y18DRAFT_437545 [Xylariaceae sp. FL1019]